jgi:hypothetical protein
VADIAIGKLTLKFSGPAPRHPERLAELIAQVLAQAPAPAVARELDAIALSVAAAGDNDTAIAARIAAQILSRLEN